MKLEECDTAAVTVACMYNQKLRKQIWGEDNEARICIYHEKLLTKEGVQFTTLTPMKLKKE